MSDFMNTFRGEPKQLNLSPQTSLSAAATSATWPAPLVPSTAATVSTVSVNVASSGNSTTSRPKASVSSANDATFLPPRPPSDDHVAYRRPRGEPAEAYEAGSVKVIGRLPGDDEDGTFQNPVVQRQKPSAGEGRCRSGEAPAMTLADPTGITADSVSGSANSALGRPKTNENARTSRECSGPRTFDVEAREEADRDEKARNMQEGRSGQQMVGQGIFSPETLSQVRYSQETFTDQMQARDSHRSDAGKGYSQVKSVGGNRDSRSSGTVNGFLQIRFSQEILIGHIQSEILTGHLQFI